MKHLLTHLSPAGLEGTAKQESDGKLRVLLHDLIFTAEWLSSINRNVRFGPMINSPVSRPPGSRKRIMGTVVLHPTITHGRHGCTPLQDSSEAQ